MIVSSTDSKPESSTSPEQERSAGFRTVRSVLLCGASVRSLAESVIAAGLRPLCVDFFEDEDLTELLSGGRGRFVNRLHTFSDLPAVTHSVRSSIPMLWAGGLENHTDILREIAERRPVIGASPDLIDRLRTPATLRGWLYDAGLDVPRLATAATADADCQWLRKPIAGSGGIGIRTVSRSANGTLSNGELAPSREYLQEYIDGVPLSALLCSDKGGIELFGTSLQLIGWPCLGASGFLFCGNVGPVDPGESVIQQVLTAAKVIVEQTGLLGVFGIDFMLCQGRAWFLEVNPRLSASHLLYERLGSRTSPSVNLIRQHLTAFGWRSGASSSVPRRSVKPAASECTTGARMIIWAQSDFSVPDDPEPPMITGSSLQVRFTDVPRPSSVIPQGSPVCSAQMVAANGHQLATLISRLKHSEGFSSLVSWPTIGRQLELLLGRFERNC